MSRQSVNMKNTTRSKIEHRDTSRLMCVCLCFFVVVFFRFFLLDDFNFLSLLNYDRGDFGNV